MYSAMNAAEIHCGIHVLPSILIYRTRPAVILAKHAALIYTRSCANIL
jgi:hypothetical protein